MFELKNIVFSRVPQSPNKLKRATALSNYVIPHQNLWLLRR